MSEMFETARFQDKLNALKIEEGIGFIGTSDSSTSFLVLKFERGIGST